MTRLKTIAQVEAEARRLGVTYGQLCAPPVCIRGCASQLYPEPLPEAEIPGEAMTPEEKCCTVCGKKLHGRQLKFCGSLCRNRFYNKERQKPDRTDEPRLCPECEKPIEGGRRKYCSLECGYRFRQRAYLKRKKASGAGRTRKEEL